MSITPYNQTLPQVDYQVLGLKRRQQVHNLRQELLIKAIGKGRFKVVLDATAGLGREALLMAGVCEKVILVERNPIVFKTLKDALATHEQDPQLSPLIQKMSLFHTCALDFMKQIHHTPPDVIYCDPMFPQRNKSAQVKKESQWLQHVVGQDQDVTNLVELALFTALHRVVVKRPLHTEFLVQEPDIQYKGRAHRFDVYLVNKKESRHESTL